MDNIPDSIKAHLYDRLTSPMFGAMFTSWLAWNYRFIVVLLSDMSAVAKFDYIENYLYPGGFLTNWATLIGYPFFTASLFLLVYPIPAAAAYWWTRQYRKKLAEIRARISADTPVSQEAHNRLQDDLLKLLAAHSVDISQFQTEIGNRDDEINALTGRIRELENAQQSKNIYGDRPGLSDMDGKPIPPNTDTDLSRLDIPIVTEKQRKILRIIENDVDLKSEVKTITRKIDGPAFRIHHDISRLIDLHAIEELEHPEASRTDLLLGLTEIGRNILDTQAPK